MSKWYVVSDAERCVNLLLFSFPD